MEVAPTSLGFTGCLIVQANKQNAMLIKFTMNDRQLKKIKYYHCAGINHLHKFSFYNTSLYFDNDSFSIIST